MKARTLWTAMVACAIGCSAAMAQPEKKPPATPKPAEKAPAAKPGEHQPTASEEAAMKAMMEAGTPGEGQKNLEQLVGEWDAVVKYRMGPDAPWGESKGTMSNKMLWDGRYLHASFTGDMEGQPFHGAGITAYNNTSKTYESTWIDSMSTAILYSTGSYDAAKKTLSLKGDSADPMQGGKKKTTRMITTVASPDRHMTEFFEPGMDGKEFKSMEITYTRKAGDGKPGKGEKHDEGKKGKD